MVSGGLVSDLVNISQIGSISIGYQVKLIIAAKPSYIYGIV